MTTPAWGVRDSTGEVVTTLDGLARVMNTDRVTAAKHLTAEEAIESACPPGLWQEAKAAARKKPGGGTPPPITTGSFVSWSNGKGRVDLVVSNGKVPGVDDDVEGSAKAPAARVTVWEDGKPTKKKIAASTHTLRRIPPLDGGKEKKDPGVALVTALSTHEQECDAYGSPEYRRLTGSAVKAAYDRGLDAWPGADHTALTREEWAVGRAEYLVKVAAGKAKNPGNDADLLHPDHPLAVRDTVTVDAGEVKALIAAFRGAAPDAT